MSAHETMAILACLAGLKQNTIYYTDHLLTVIEEKRRYQQAYGSSKDP